MGGHIRGTLFSGCVAAMVVLLRGALAVAEVNELDLGAHPANGPAAIASMHAREVATVRALACNDEFHFLVDIDNGEKSGTDWPLAHLTAKAALLTGRFDLPRSGTSDGPPLGEGGCIAPENDPNLEKWKTLFFRDVPYLNLPPEEVERRRREDNDAWHVYDTAGSFLQKVGAVQAALNMLYVRRFGPACDHAAPPGAIFGETPTLVLTPACLMAQIAAVVTNPRHGAWKYDKDSGALVPRQPGTTADKLPCPTDWALFNEGFSLNPGDWTWPWENFRTVDGDWDMSVIEDTRLTYVLYNARAVRPALSGDANAALDKLNRWLLTLRGGPAAQSYHPFWSCGNATNGFGTAEDSVDDNDVYDKDRDKTVSGEDDDSRSFWESLWKIFRFFLVVAAIGFVIGYLLGALAGAALAGGVAGAAAAVAIVGAAVIISTLFIAGIEETENHLLMQNTSKYLKNKLMMAELRAAGNHDAFDDVADDNDDVRDWLLEKMHDIVEDEFVEYNSKPYGRLSLESLVNLIDFACEVSWSWDEAADPPRGERSCDDHDKAIVTAASSVLDLSAAKMALGSSQGRRLIPYRRLVKENTRYRDKWEDEGGSHDPKHFLDLANGADHLIAAFEFWAGTTQHGPNGHASYGSVKEMIWHATSNYRPDEMILDLALDKSTRIEQTFNHHTYERYSSGPGWLLTAGGDSEHAAQGLKLTIGVKLYFLSPTDDKGVGVPTTLMAGGTKARRDTITDFLRFEGTKEEWAKDGTAIMQSFSENRCVTGPFACGLRFEIPQAIEACLQKPHDNIWVTASLRFISSAACDEYKDDDGNPSNNFFVAVFRTSCAPPGPIAGNNCNGRPWGLIEVAPASQFGGSLNAYEDAFVNANRGNLGNWEKGQVGATLTFWSAVDNREIKFRPSDEDFDEDCRACGSVVRHESGARITINHPRRAGRIFIDLNDEKSPIRRGEGGVVLVTP
jgi:hypothetical protein